MAATRTRTASPKAAKRARGTGARRRSALARGSAPPAVTWEQALAWRLSRQLLGAPERRSVAQVVRRLAAVQAQVASSAELAVRVRRATSRAGDVTRALAQGHVLKTWAMRGTLHLLAPEDAADYLALLAAGRSWEKPIWQRYFGVTPRHWQILRPAVRDALGGGALTREELAAAVTATRGLRHLGESLLSGWGTLLKPLAWQGDLCFGPSRGSRVTFMRPEAASARWTGVVDVAAAAPRAVAAYLRAYGPATPDVFGNWLMRGRIGKRTLQTWFAALGERVVEIDVGGERNYILADDLDELMASTPGGRVRLLPAFDPWVLGPGTDHPRVVPPALPMPESPATR